MFFDGKAKHAFDNADMFELLVNLAAGCLVGITFVDNADVELDDSVGLAFTAGFDFALTDNIRLSMSYYIAIDTEAEITTDSNLGKIKTSATHN
ncbi:MAG: outer membrane protein W [Pseudohongiellaceae bacterium]